MRVMTLKEALAFLTMPAPEGLGMKISYHALRKMTEPDVDGRRGLPFFKEPGTGRTAKLLTTDEALREHYRRLAEAALEQIHQPPGAAGGRRRGAR